MPNIIPGLRRQTRSNLVPSCLPVTREGFSLNSDPVLTALQKVLQRRIHLKSIDAQKCSHALITAEAFL